MLHFVATKILSVSTMGAEPHKPPSPPSVYATEIIIEEENYDELSVLEVKFHLSAAEAEVSASLRIQPPRASSKLPTTFI